jgi:phosphoglycolate phosphatase-like HAD superfamily hydrolase
MEAASFIFDVEGTLVDFVPQVLNCWMVIFSNWRQSVPPYKLAAYSGMDPNDMLVQLLPDIDKKSREAMIAEHEADTAAHFFPLHGLSRRSGICSKKSNDKITGSDWRRLATTSNWRITDA